MSATSILVHGIKSRLRAQGMTYRGLAELVGVIEPTVKRDLSRGKISLQRLDKICEVLGVEITDLLQPAEDAQLTELSEQQERALVAHPKLIVAFRPLTRIRKLTSRNFSWRKDGPVHSRFAAAPAVGRTRQLHGHSCHEFLGVLRILASTPRAEVAKGKTENAHDSRLLAV